MTPDTPTSATAPPYRRRTSKEVLAAAKPYRDVPTGPLHVLGTDGRLCVSIPLLGTHGKGKRVVVDEVDWDRACRTYGGRWTIKPAGKGYGYVAGMAKHQQVYLARAITGAQPGEAVMFRDGNALNLARGNLEVMGKREAVMRAFGRGDKCSTPPLTLHPTHTTCGPQNRRC